MGSEWNSPSSVTVVMNWLTWKRNNPIHGLQKAIDLLKKVSSDFICFGCDN